MNRVAHAVAAADEQIGGSHYADMSIQPWDAMDAWLTPEELRGYHKGTVIAYLARERQKGGNTDIRKAAHHMRKLCELLDGAAELAPFPELQEDFDACGNAGRGGV